MEVNRIYNPMSRIPWHGHTTQSYIIVTKSMWHVLTIAGKEDGEKQIVEMLREINPSLSALRVEFSGWSMMADIYSASEKNGSVPSKGHLSRIRCILAAFGRAYLEKLMSESLK